MVFLWSIQVIVVLENSMKMNKSMWTYYVVVRKEVDFYDFVNNLDMYENMYWEEYKEWLILLLKGREIISPDII